MHRKTVLLVQEGLGNTERYAQVIAQMDADSYRCQPQNLSSCLDGVDLVVYCFDSTKTESLSTLEATLAESGTPVLLIVAPEILRQLRLPVRVPSDFALTTASEDELLVRLRHLLWPGEETSSADFITVDSMSINLSTYQVQVDGVPVDFTYLEYALLAFLVTHPGHAYSRDTLLRRVWGFEYYGGSRTVDVHVRRVRAKLGTELSARLETVRGVGYMWSM